MEKILYSRLFQDLIGEDALQAIKCGICWEFYNNPVILPCGHTFCYDCLLEMGRHAKMNRIHIPFRDLRINCPNCRFPILVHILMSRNITFNYPLASFIESLRTTDDKQKVDASTDTDSAIYDYDIKKLDRIKEDLDSIFSAFRINNNVVDDARQDINKIRREFNQYRDEEDQRGNTLPALKDVPPPPGFSRVNNSEVQHPVDFHDPAILYRVAQIPGAPAFVPVQGTSHRDQLKLLFQNAHRQ